MIVITRWCRSYAEHGESEAIQAGFEADLLGWSEELSNAWGRMSAAAKLQLCSFVVELLSEESGE